MGFQPQRTGLRINRPYDWLHPPVVHKFHNRRYSALRIFHSEQAVRSEPDHLGPFGIGKNIELLLLNCIEDQVSDLERRHAGLHGGLECAKPAYLSGVIATGSLRSSVGL